MESKMKKFLLSILIVLMTTLPASAEYFSDIIVTSPDGLWTDERAYASLADAITAVGANDRIIVVASNETVTDLTVPSNVILEFKRGGMITYSGQLSINNPTIIAGNVQIFNATGAGEADFAHGTNLRASWFEDLHEMFDQTLDNYVTCIIDSGWAANIDADCQVGNNVNLRWEGPGNRLVINTGFTLSNIKNIEAGNYQIFAGSGDFDFLDSTYLKLSWFNNLRSALTWIEAEEAIIVITGTNTVAYDSTVAANELLDFISEKGELAISAGVTLTISSTNSIISDDRQIFTGAGTVTYSDDIGIVKGIWDGSDDDINIYSDEDINLEAVSDINISAGSDLDLLSTGGDVNIDSSGGDDVNITAEDDISLIVDAGDSIYGNFGGTIRHELTQASHLITSPVLNSAYLYLLGDNNDDDGSYRIEAEDSGYFRIASRGTGAWVDYISIANGDGRLFAQEVYSDVANDRAVYVEASGLLGTLSSDARDKVDKGPIEDTSWIYNLIPRKVAYKQYDTKLIETVNATDSKGNIIIDKKTGLPKQLRKFNDVWNGKEDKVLHYSLYAQEVADYNDIVIQRDKDGIPDYIDYNGLIVVIINEMKKLRSEIDELKAK